MKSLQPPSYAPVLRLRTRLTAILVVMLGIVCLIIGVSSYVTVKQSLYSQVQSRLDEASHRASNPPFDNDFPLQSREREPAECNQLNGKGLLNAPGQASGTLSLCAVNGQVTADGVLNTSGGQDQLSDSDKQKLLNLPDDGSSVKLEVEAGHYLVNSHSTGANSIIVTGVPLDDTRKTLAVLVSVTGAGSLAAMVFAGWFGSSIIRRTMQPLERVSSVATDIAELDLATTRVPENLRVERRDTNPATEVGSVGHALNQLINNVDSALVARQRTEDQMRVFVADASHELRTPLAAIKGYSDLMRWTENLSSEGEKSLGRIDSQTSRMSHLVEDLLLLARLDEGRELKLSDVDLTELLVENVLDLQVAAPDHEWHINVPDEPIEVRGDQNQLQQVVLNLLSNARKHTDAGTVVTASLSLSDDGKYALISIEDNGQGIDPEFQPKIFDRFSRADKARSGSDGTSGLGLPIVKAIVEAHRGQISVDSHPGATKFTVMLPRD